MKATYVKQMLLVSLIAIFAIVVLTACSFEKTQIITTGDITEENIEPVCELLRSSELSNVDVFEQWVKDTASGETNDNTETSGFSDADCRMTVMLLAGNLISFDSVEEQYTGDYLMFDVDAIENNDAYSLLKDKEQLFTTMFGEMPITKSGFADTLSERWNKHGIRVASEKCSVISILFKAYEQEAAFVGHAGILIDCSDSKSVDSNYVFVEKLAFSEPFRITLLKDEKELLDVLSGRSDYTVEENDPSPVVYKNDKQIGTLKR